MPRVYITGALCELRVHDLAAISKLENEENRIRQPLYQALEFIATGAKKAWSWDITKLLGPTKWSYFDRYVALDMFWPRCGGFDAGLSVIGRVG